MEMLLVLVGFFAAGLVTSLALTWFVALCHRVAGRLRGEEAERFDELQTSIASISQQIASLRQKGDNEKISTELLAELRRLQEEEAKELERNLRANEKLPSGQGRELLAESSALLVK